MSIGPPLSKLETCSVLAYFKQLFMVVGLILSCSARIYWRRACKKRICKVKSAPTDQKCNQNDSNNEFINLELEAR